jgi:hypothetical protein
MLLVDSKACLSTVGLGLDTWCSARIVVVAHLQLRTLKK